MRPRSRLRNCARVMMMMIGIMIRRAGHSRPLEGGAHCCRSVGGLGGRISARYDGRRGPRRRRRPRILHGRRLSPAPLRAHDAFIIRLLAPQATRSSVSMSPGGRLSPHARAIWRPAGAPQLCQSHTSTAQLPGNPFRFVVCLCRRAFCSPHSIANWKWKTAVCLAHTIHKEAECDWNSF